MAISFVGAQGNASTTVTIPTHQSGDLILIFAYRDTSGITPPSTPAAGGTVPTWTLVRTGTGSTNSFNCRYAVATSSTTTSGTWTNATEIICLVYRGAKVVGANASTSDSGTTITFPALTLNRTNNTSWVVGFAGHRTATNVEQAPTGMTNRTSAGTEAAGHDTNGTVSSWSQQTVTVNQFAGNQGCTVELRDGALTVTGDAGSFSETGQAATFIFGKTLASAAGAFTEAGQAATLSATRRLIGEVGAFTEAGQAATLTYATLSNNYTLAGGIGSYGLTGQAADLRTARVAAGAAGSCSLTGQAATLSKGGASQSYTLTAAAGAVTTTGQTAGLTAGRKVGGGAGALVTAGQPAGLRRGFLPLGAAAGALTVTGQAVDYGYARKLGGAAGPFTLAGQQATPKAGRLLVSAAAGYSAAGQASTLSKAERRRVVIFM